jgi:hypothetical protein
LEEVTLSLAIMNMLRAGIAWKVIGKANLHTVAQVYCWRFLGSNEPEIDGFGIRHLE